jgi:hypothetical protein
MENKNEMPRAYLYITYGYQDGHYAANVITINGTPDYFKRFGDHPPIRTPWYISLGLMAVDNVNVTANAAGYSTNLNIYTNEGNLTLNLTKKQLKHLVDVASAILEE